MTRIKIDDFPDMGVITIELPGLEAIQINAYNRTIAVDGVSGVGAGSDTRGWALHDLRDGIYGDFHRLTSWVDCTDVECFDVRAEHLNETDHNEARPEHKLKAAS